MNEAGSHNFSRHIKIYLVVGISLLLATVLTVTMYYVHLSSVATTIAVALFIASVKASLVACFFMHLISEKKAIYLILAFTGIFFAAMMYMMVWSRDQVPRGLEYPPTKYVPRPLTGEAR